MANYCLIISARQDGNLEIYMCPQSVVDNPPDDEESFPYYPTRSVPRDKFQCELQRIGYTLSDADRQEYTISSEAAARLSEYLVDAHIMGPEDYGNMEPPPW